MYKGKRLHGWYYVKNVSRHQHDKNQQSRIATVDSCFALVVLDIVNGSFCNLCALALWLALHIFATQVWRAPIRAKQLPNFCDPALSVLVMLMSWNVFHVVSALQSVVFILFLMSIWDVTDCTKTCRASEGREKALRWRSIPATERQDTQVTAPSFVRVGSIGKWLGTTEWGRTRAEWGYWLKRTRCMRSRLMNLLHAGVFSMNWQLVYPIKGSNKLTSNWGTTFLKFTITKYKHKYKEMVCPPGEIECLSISQSFSFSAFDEVERKPNFGLWLCRVGCLM